MEVGIDETKIVSIPLRKVSRHSFLRLITLYSSVSIPLRKVSRPLGIYITEINMAVSIPLRKVSRDGGKAVSYRGRWFPFH